MAAHGATVLGCEGAALTEAERAFFRAADPWGFILFKRNIEDPAQLRRLTSDLREAVGRDAVVMIDQEGGRVARLRPPHWRAWPDPRAQIDAVGPERAARAMWLRYRLMAHEMRAVGIDCDCAPVADLRGPDTHPFLDYRCYGDTVETVVEIAGAVAQALLSGGVLPVMKHLPGHGRANADTHHDLPEVTAAPEVLEATDFATFRALNTLPMAMSAHVIFPAWDQTRPATQSPEMIRVMREVIGFGGLLLTDDLSMEALSGTIADRARFAVEAGCDIALHCNGVLAEMEAVAEVSGRLSPQGAVRAEAALAARQIPDPIDIRALEAELEGLMTGPGNV
ncbi:beta-N-acetylhexosaminidase [Acidimangrovimonas sediminis]|uniref:beta-N-acetylhexosaminidase n=1 Tax=Acidimangrovimonas sediminis TaxID=2056283 RepID=UPI000C803BA7|nr:beta-N-acetylhexosaminidase [Acidimangrovimonas sediminis]